MTMPFSICLLGHIENQQLLKYLSQVGSKWKENPSCSPESVEQPYLHLGTHPNVVTRLWNTFAAELPVNCNWVVYGMPVLVNPQSAVIFAFGGGTVYVLRLPPDLRSRSLDFGFSTTHRFSNGTVLDLAEFGEGWIFGRGRSEEKSWCVSAYEYSKQTFAKS